MWMAARAPVTDRPEEIVVPSRRSFLSAVFGPAALTGGLLAGNRTSARSATPQFVGIDGWLNTGRPLTVAGLRGKVVLVEFCTYTCINWRRTLPYVNRWHSEYGPQGLQIIGIHTPEFDFESVRPNVESAIRELDVRFPIAQDNEYQTWNAWGNRAWPSFYLLDRDGQVRLVREGEGYAQEMEGAIRSLLGLPRMGASEHPADDADLSRVATPEMYFGSQHPTPQDRAQSPRQGEATYTFVQPGPKLSEYQADGSWERGEEALVLRSSLGRVRVRFSAAKLYLVAGASQPAAVRVSVDGGGERTIEVSTPTLYTLLDGNGYGEHLLELTCATQGLSLFSATFG
jgi:thiol-disulfide isomerase/thioredoxin